MQPPATSAGSSCRLRRALLAIAIPFVLAAAPSSAAAYGTIDGGPAELGGPWKAEHERITRAALACTAKAAPRDCFQPISMAMLAGARGELGGVGRPDDPRDQDATMPAAHCDEADFLAGFNPPEREIAARQALVACVTGMRDNATRASASARGILVRGRDEVARHPRIDTASCGDGRGGPVARAKCGALDGFGRLLHAAQDFYSHSNWTDRRTSIHPPSFQDPPALGMRREPDFLDLLPTVSPGQAARFVVQGLSPRQDLAIYVRPTASLGLGVGIPLHQQDPEAYPQTRIGRTGRADVSFKWPETYLCRQGTCRWRDGETVAVTLCSDDLAPNGCVRELVTFRARQPAIPGETRDMRLPGLTTGCFSKYELPAFYAAGLDSCPSRIRHVALNKDKGDIDPVTGEASEPRTPRGGGDPNGTFGIPTGFRDNFATSVRWAIRETQLQWEALQERLLDAYGPVRGELVICALTHDDPVKRCAARSVESGTRCGNLRLQREATGAGFVDIRTRDVGCATVKALLRRWAREGYTTPEPQGWTCEPVSAGSGGLISRAHCAKGRPAFVVTITSA